MSFFDDTISTIGRGLAQTVAGQIDDATGLPVGNVLNTLFGNNQQTGGADFAGLLGSLAQDWSGTQSQLTILQGSIQQQQQMLQAIGNQLTALASAISNITGEIQNIELMLQKIDQQELYNAWSDSDNHVTDYIAQINTSFQTYAEYTAGYSSTKAELVSQLVTDILNTDSGPKVAVTAISAYIIDDGQKKGVLQLWANMVLPLIEHQMLDYREAVSQYFDYYRKLVYAQLRATNLVVEAYQFNGDAQGAADAWRDYRQAILAQENTFITWLVQLVTAGSAITVTGPSHDFQVASFGAAYSALQLNAGLQRLPGGDQTTAYYAPSELFREAEQLLANLYVTGDQDRRIVVHMLYVAGGPIGSLVGAVQLPLSPTTNGVRIQPTGSYQLGAPYTYPGGATTVTTFNDYNFDSTNFTAVGTFYVTRFVYAQVGANSSGLPDGDYNIANLNGSNGLVPQETYISMDTSTASPPFQHQTMLDYVLHVDGAQRFDFANFVAYNIPLTGPTLEN